MRLTLRNQGHPIPKRPTPLNTNHRCTDYSSLLTIPQGMSSGWSYFSLSGPRRRTSVSLPRSNPPITGAEYNPSETSASAAARHSRRRSGHATSFMNEYKNGAMNQGKKVRVAKTAGIIAFVVAVLYFFAPRGGLSSGVYILGSGYIWIDRHADK